MFLTEIKTITENSEPRFAANTGREIYSYNRMKMVALICGLKIVTNTR